MKAVVERLVTGAGAPGTARNLVREYLQARLLESLQRGGAMTHIAFHGGTALRFLYSLPRFSEDLDFTLERGAERFDLEAHLRLVERDLRAEGYATRITLTRRASIHRAQVRFPGLLHDLGLSGHEQEALMVRVEVDVRPPAGAVLETTLVRRHVILNLYHHDRATLLAGKLHAVLQRAYTKGRDLYDLLWYLSAKGWPEPNLALLNNALEQTGWPGATLEPGTWRKVVADRLADLDFTSAVRDLRPFLESQHEADLVTHEHLAQLLGRRP